VRGLYILGEGPTEEEFIKGVLRPYFNKHGVYDVRCILMTTSLGHKGGDVSFQRYKLNAENLLKNQPDIIVTSLIDFFRLKTDFPNYEEAIIKFPDDKVKRVEFLENAISIEINHPRFIPYIQLHEFEGLLFSSNEGFDYLPDIPNNNRLLLARAIQEQKNPELLNDGQNTAPSKRLIHLIPGYQKTFHGPLIASIVTIETMLLRCSRFNNWIESLISKMKV